MSTTSSPHPHAAPHDGYDGYAPDAAPQPGAPAPDAATAKARWPLFGVAGAAASFAAVVLSIPVLDEEDYSAGPEVVEELSAGPYRVAFLLGLVAVGCLLVAGAGWRRWAEARAPRDLAARTVGQGLIATATVNTAFYGITGAMGLYLEGGVEADTGVNDQGLYVYHVILDFGSLLGWWTTGVAAIAVATLALRRARLLPRWMGVVSILLLLPPVLMALTTSLPGFIGFTMPIWLVVISLGMMFSKQAHAAG